MHTGLVSRENVHHGIGVRLLTCLINDPPSLSLQDQHIRQLEERVAVLGRTRDSNELELKCMALQRQVDEMEVRSLLCGCG